MFSINAVPLRAMSVKRLPVGIFWSFLLCCLLLVINGCDTYQKILKSSDYTFKYEKVKEYYNTGQYDKALPLFEELMGVYKGTKEAEKLYYFYAYCHYGLEDYLSASHYFKSFIDAFPRSIYAEDAQFMIGYSYYKMSPQPSLEQSNSEKAIEAFQLFLNSYANSSKTERCNELIDNLRLKLENKAFSNAELYFKIKTYKAAATAYRGILVDFPDTRRKEEVMFKVLKSYYLLALNSIEEKKQERYQFAADAYLEFIDQFPNSKYNREAERIYTTCTNNLAKIKANGQQ